jgi:PDZ domain/Aspartyl protease
MKRRSFFGLLLIGLLVATAYAQPAPSKSVAPIEIPFDLVTRHIVVKVSVNGSRPLSFVFDTGDQVGIIDLERAKELKLKLGTEVKVGGAGSGHLVGAMIENSSWTLNGLDGFAQPIMLALPFATLSARFGHDFDGIIGSSFIKQFVVEVDYQARKLKLHPRDTFTYAGPGESLAIQFNGQGHPLVNAVVTPVGGEAIKGKFVIDLGSGGSLALHSPFVNSHKLLGSGLKTIKAIGSGGAGGQVNGQIGRVAEVSIGTFKIAGPTTLFSEDEGGAFASSQLAGNIGQQIMSKFRIFLDYGRERIILEPNKTFADQFDRASAGLALRAEDQNYRTFRVTDVLENSPASEAGLQKDDLIIKIDDQPETELTMTKVNEMFEKPMPRNITIRRGDQTLKVTLTPRKLI